MKKIDVRLRFSAAQDYYSPEEMTLLLVNRNHSIVGRPNSLEIIPAVYEDGTWFMYNSGYACLHDEKTGQEYDELFVPLFDNDVILGYLCPAWDATLTKELGKVAKKHKKLLSP